MSSNIDQAQKELSVTYNLVEGDVTKPESLKRAIDGNDAVFINLNAKLDNDLYQKIEIEGTANVATVSAQMGIKRIGNISGVSSRGVESGVIFLDAKVRAEKAIIESGVPYSIMRPSWFFESLPRFIQMGKAVVLGDQPMKISWLAASDYAHQVSNAFKSENAANKCFYNLGPEKMTMTQALEKYCANRHPDLTPEVIPLGMAKTMAMLPGMGQLKKAIPFFEYFQTNNEDVDPAETEQILGANKTTLDQWLA